MQQRSCGVLLHISSLPSPYGIGDFGPAAYSFAASLAGAGIKFWQFLPLTPTSEFIGNSPYSSPSAFAGNALFISPELLVQDGVISVEDCCNIINNCGVTTDCSANLKITNSGGASVNSGRVNYSAVTAQREALLNYAYERNQPALAQHEGFNAFCGKQAFWLNDYALFAAIKHSAGGISWVKWPAPLKWREPDAIQVWAEQNRSLVTKYKYIQYLFFAQLNAFKRACAEWGVQLIGDMPMYVTHDSADVWSAPQLFNLDADGNPLTVAGVPPDYFSETGQRWGNPVYRWGVMRNDNYAWWKKRLEHNFAMTNMVRLDHFRAFCGYWEIPASEETAVNGQWATAPGQELFSALRQHFGSNLPIIAEDLGIITDDVRTLMQEFSLPGMKVLHFAFGGSNPAQNPDSPFRHQPNSIVYTGTHDNTTTKHWFCSAAAEERENFCAYCGRILNEDTAVDAMLRLALESSAAIAIIPLQDIIAIGEEGRMNTPSVARGNWEWRLANTEGLLDYKTFYRNQAGQAVCPMFSKLHRLCAIYGRL